MILNKDGSLLRCFAFRGPDLESATEGELVAACARANNALRRFGAGWALFFEARRVEAIGYPDSVFPDPASWLVDQERRGGFAAQGRHFESRYFGSLVYLPPADAGDAAARSLVDRQEAGKGGRRDWRGAVRSFVAETDRFLDLLGGFMPSVRALCDAETLTYLHEAISDRSHPVSVPGTPAYLDALLADTPLVGGLEPRLGALHLRTLTLRGFPDVSRPGLLDALNHQAFDYRWVTRFIALDRDEAARMLTRIRRQWFNKRKSIAALLREVMHNEPAQLLDSDADNKVVDADAALQALGGGHVAFGYLTTTLTVSDTDVAQVEAKLRTVERIVGDLGFTCQRESVNAVEAWLSSIPGQVYANVRQPPIHTLNLAHLMPLSSLWAGPRANDHLDGPVLLQASASGSTPFRLSTHVGDVGHMMIVGPTGAGKSVLLALMALQFRRYPGAHIVLFDRGLSARAAVLAMGGTHHTLGAGPEETQGEPFSFQPLARVDEENERRWAADWIASLIMQERGALDPEAREQIWSALTSLASAPVAERTLTGLSLLLQSNALRLALAPYTLQGPHGLFLDAATEALGSAAVQCFETEALMGNPTLAAAVLTYLFHRLEQRLDGRPTLFVLDEAWSLLDDTLFAGQIRDWLKTLRKKNAAVVFATQSLADIEDSSIAPALIESCPQRIFLPNDRALEPQASTTYARFGLNERQIQLIGEAIPKRQYWLNSARGNRLFSLDLGPIALALCGASDPASKARIDAQHAAHGGENFLVRFLDGCGLGWASKLASEFAAPGDRAAPLQTLGDVSCV